MFNWEFSKIAILPVDSILNSPGIKIKNNELDFLVFIAELSVC